MFSQRYLSSNYDDKATASMKAELIRQLTLAQTFNSSVSVYPRPGKDALKAITRHQLGLIQSESNANRGTMQRLNYITSSAHFCDKTSLDELAPITLKDMHVNRVHHGRYLLCQVVVRAFRQTGLLTVIRDEHDELENLSFVKNIIFCIKLRYFLYIQNFIPFLIQVKKNNINFFIL
jgi:hypothetical protein